MAKAVKPAEGNNEVAENSSPVVPLSSTESAAQAEEKAAGLKRDPNVVANRYPTGMTIDQAHAVVKRYEGFKGTEVPPELEQARVVLKKSK